MGEAAARFAAGDLARSEALCVAILAADPRHFHALHLRAAIAARRGDWGACIEHATRALALRPDHGEVLSNRGAALRMLDRYEEALADYDRAIAAAPQHAEAFNNRGVALAALNRHEEAIASYDRALALQPGYARARFNRALSRLVLGDYARGWDDYEARWEGSDPAAPRRRYVQPEWDGKADLRGRTILLYAEQGLGDAVQFARYVPLVRARGARVLLEVHAPLKPWLAQLVNEGDAFALGEALPAFDFHCALLSLARAFGTRVESIPAAIPYLEAPAEHVERWRSRLGARPGPRIGLAWSGSPTLRNDRHRTIALAALAPLLAQPATWIALQKDVRDADRAFLERGELLHFGAELHDFRDTAALAALVDAVICVDTSIAHVAGALGRPLQVLLPYAPDWRWLLGRDDSPWYPGARLLRQPRIGDWDSVVARVAAQLRQGALDAPSGAKELPRVE